MKRAYIEITSDVPAGFLPSQVVYYHLPASVGSIKLRVKQDKYWIVKCRKDWWDECRLKPRQVDTTLAGLKSLGPVTTVTYNFQDCTPQHIRLKNVRASRPLSFLSEDRDDTKQGSAIVS